MTVQCAHSFPGALEENSWLKLREVVLTALYFELLDTRFHKKRDLPETGNDA